jgi:hypothetical protein
MLILCPHGRASVVFGFFSGQISFGFSIEEELVCGVRSCSENFVLRNENIFTFQLTANIEFSEGRR